MFKSSQYNNLVYETTESKYCYNSFSGELIKFNNEVYNYINTIFQNKNPKDSPYFTYLLQKGFIVDISTNEYVKIHSMRKEIQYSTDSERSSFIIALTTHCNIKCVYCYEEGCKQISMNTNTALQVIDFIKTKCTNNTKLKLLNITWFGGEPLLAIDSIKLIGDSLLNYCIHNNIVLKTNIITNGLLLNKDKLNILKAYNLSDIQISMDGCDDYYEKYKNISSNLLKQLIINIDKICTETSITLRLNCSKDNFESIKQLIIRLYTYRNIRENVILSFSQLKSESITEFSDKEFSEKKIDLLNLLIKLGWQNQLINFVPIPKTIPCGLMQTTNFVIDPEGYLYKCEHFVGNSIYSVGTIEKGLLYPSFYNDFLECPMFKECETCSIYPICRGGCSQKSFMGQSSVDCTAKQKEITEIFRLIIQENIKL